MPHVRVMKKCSALLAFFALFSVAACNEDREAQYETAAEAPAQGAFNARPSMARRPIVKPGYSSNFPWKTFAVVRILCLICLAAIPSLYLGFLTFVALWLGVMQFFLLKPGQAPDPQFLVLGSVGAVGLWGLWVLVLIPVERLRLSNGLRIAATAASVAGIMLAITFLSGDSLYGWSFGPHQNLTSIYMLGGPLLLAHVRIFEVWRQCA